MKWQGKREEKKSHSCIEPSLLMSYLTSARNFYEPINELSERITFFSRYFQAIVNYSTEKKQGKNV